MKDENSAKDNGQKAGEEAPKTHGEGNITLDQRRQAMIDRGLIKVPGQSDTESVTSGKEGQKATGADGEDGDDNRGGDSQKSGGDDTSTSQKSQKSVANGDDNRGGKPQESGGDGSQKEPDGENPPWLKERLGRERRKREKLESSNRHLAEKVADLEKRLGEGSSVAAGAEKPEASESAGGEGSQSAKTAMAPEKAAQYYGDLGVNDILGPQEKDYAVDNLPDGYDVEKAVLEDYELFLENMPLKHLPALKGAKGQQGDQAKPAAQQQQQNQQTEQQKAEQESLRMWGFIDSVAEGGDAKWQSLLEEFKAGVSNNDIALRMDIFSGIVDIGESGKTPEEQDKAEKDMMEIIECLVENPKKSQTLYFSKKPVPDALNTMLSRHRHNKAAKAESGSEATDNQTETDRANVTSIRGARSSRVGTSDGSTGDFNNYVSQRKAEGIR